MKRKYKKKIQYLQNLHQQSNLIHYPSSNKSLFKLLCQHDDGGYRAGFKFITSGPWHPGIGTH